MSTVDGITKARALAIEAASIVGFTLDASGNLVFVRKDTSTIPAGNIRGPQGASGSIAEYASASTYPTTGIAKGSYIDDAALGLTRYDGSKWNSFGVGGDTGWISTGVAVGAGSSAATVLYRVINGNEVSINATFTFGAAMTSSAVGNVTDTVMATLPAVARPPSGSSPVALFSTNKGTDGAAGLTSAGSLTVRSFYPGVTIAAGDIGQCYFNFLNN